jgi:ribonucleoside-diphosphate reductase alpha chain
MKVVKRNGSLEPISFDKVLGRIRKASKTLMVNPDSLAQQVLARIYDGVKTSEIDELTSQLAVSLSTNHPDYGILASRIAISNHQKNTDSSFSNVMLSLANQINTKTNEPVSHVNDILVSAIKEFGKEIDAKIDYDRDYLFDYFGFKTFEKSYLLRDSNRKVLERPQHLWMRVSLAIWPNDMKKAFETYDYMSQKYFTHATPTLFNAGTNHQQLSSCFLLAMTSDSVSGIYKTLSDCALISKHSGGIGLHISNIRARGSAIKGTNGISDGIVPMLRVFNNTARYINQGGRRNGSFAMYLEPWHADVEDFLRMKQNTGAEEERARDLFYALWIPDLFMRRIESNGTWSLFCPNEAPGLDNVIGEEFEALYMKYENEKRYRKQVSAQKLWFQILDSQIESGTPYLLYKDAANKKSNQQNLGVIKSSNLCVAPETDILTDKGHIQIKDAVNTKVNVWNGTQFSEVEVKQTGKNQKLISVNLSNGAVLTCTPYHKFIIRENYYDYKSLDKAKRVDASNLKAGMKLAKWDAPIIQGDSKYDFKYAYTHGFFCGDGTYNNSEYTKDSPILCLYGEKKYLIDKLDIRSTSGEEDSMGRINTTLHKDIEKKFNVPMNATITNKLEWLAGLLDADGSVARNGTNEALQIGSIKKSFLDKILFMLQTLGVNAKVTLMRESSERLLPDGNGGNKLYNCKPLWRLLISSSGLYQLSRLGLKTYRIKFDSREPQRNSEQFVTVVSIEDNNRYDDTYCFNEPINHAGVFNGILTGNCSEIIEYSDANETAVCNLASIGLPTFIKKDKFDFNLLRKIVVIVTTNLNRVIDINFYPTPETQRSNMRHRPIGIGVQGLADVFAMLKMSWDSKEAIELNKKIFEHMYYAALEASVELAKKEGPYETFQGSPASKGVLQFDMWNVIPSADLEWDKLKKSIVKHGLRNSLLVAPMPTASTSQILGFNECFEPFTTNIYSRRTLAGEYIVINKYLVKELLDMNMWDEEMKQMIIANNGSIQLIEGISNEMKNRYKTGWELSQKVIIDMAADRGAYICQSQSLNLFVADPNYAKLTSMHFHAWKRGLKTGCYYLRTKAPVAAQKFTVTPVTPPTNTTSVSEKSEEKIKRERKELLDKLAAEYQEEQDKGCTNCSA